MRTRLLSVLLATVVAAGGVLATAPSASAGSPIEGIPGCYWSGAYGGGGFCVFADGVWVFDANGNYHQLPNSPGYDPILG